MTEAVLSRYYAALQSGSMADMSAAVTDDLVVSYHDAAGVLPWSGEWVGTEGLIGFLATVSEHLSIDHIDVLSTEFLAEKAIVHLRGHWTSRATGRSFSAEVINIFSFRDDRVSGYEVFPDSAAFALAIGRLGPASA